MSATSPRGARQPARTAVRIGLLVLCVGTLFAARTGAAQTTDPPNIVLILADDLGWGDLGYFGNNQIQTPRLDLLAQEGTSFSHFYAPAPVCSPTRAGILTGFFPGRLRIHSAISNDHFSNLLHGMPDWLDPDVPTVADILRVAGYATGLFGKWHLGGGEGAPSPGAYGIDDHVTISSTGPHFTQQGTAYFRALSTTYIVDEAIRFIEENQGSPFFLNVWTLLPHATLNPTPEQLAVYDHLAPEGVPWVGARQIYYASVTAMDEQIGRLVDRIDELGLANNTLIIFASDNGPSSMSSRNTSHSGVGSPGPSRGGKWSLYEGGVRVPLVVRWPGHVPAGVIDNTSVISAVDFLPTFFALSDSPSEPMTLLYAWVTGGGLDGEDVSDILLGVPRPRTKTLFWERRFGQGSQPTIERSPLLAMRSGPWKLLLNPDGSRVELYDVVADPGESDNLAGQRKKLVQFLSAEALAWQATLPPGPFSNDAGDNFYPWPPQ
jgi:N-acetylgalactosamine-6-sulfatase